MSLSRIRRLSPALINKIAAGEVVERPASVLKELVENAIDAEASRIEVTLENGGKRLIRVADDGIGMPADDLALAFESHATSKLAEPDDLFAIHTLGFRGEALASIGAVSRCRVVSRPRGGAAGATIECIGGRLGKPRSCGAPEGTIIEVRDLFFNTPARLKFLRTTATELRHILEAATRLSLPYPGLALHMLHNGRTTLKLTPCRTQRERLGALLGDDTCAQLLPVHSESSAMTLTGFISGPGGGGSRSCQYVFLNGRYIRDRAIQRAIAEAYRNRLMKGRYPVVCLYLQMDPTRADVNVHPTKVEVRFRDAGAVFAQVLTALEKTLSGAGPSPGRLPPSGRGERGERVRQAIADFFQKSPGPSETPAAESARYAREGHRPPTPPRQREETREIEEREFKVPPAERPDSRRAAAPAAPRRCFQLHDTFIVEETDNGFLLIDQHALHERILYEELTRRAARASVPRQRLLMPEVVELRPQDFMLLMEVKDELLSMGVEVEPFGENTVAVQAVPHMAAAADPRELVLDILGNIESAPPGVAPKRRERVIETIACKAAIKAGERLGRTQMEALLDRRDQLGPEPTCPHGRPTTVHFSADELDKMFRRK